MKKITYLMLVLVILILSAMLYIERALAGEFDEEIYMGKVFLEAEFLDGDLLKISARASDVLSPVIGMAFHLNYEENKLAFLRYDPGDFLEKGGDPFYLVKNLGTKLIFGETLRRDDSFPLGDGKITDFYFQIADGEDWEFRFENGVISGLDETRQDIDKISWEDLRINRSGQRLGSAYAGSGTGSLLDYAKSGQGNSFFSGRYLNFVVLLMVTIFTGGVFVYSKKRGENRHV